MRTLGPAMQCPNCRKTVYIASTGPILEHCYRGPWRVNQSGALQRPGDGEGNLALHHCPGLR